jgi:hypothetical protein
MASHRFGDAEADNIFSSFDDEESRECIVKKCLKYDCEKAGLVVVVQIQGDGSLEKCHLGLQEDSDGERWHVVYGGMLVGTPLHENPAYEGLVSVFTTLGAGPWRRLLEISKNVDHGGFFTDDSGTDYVELARKRGFMVDGGETGAEFKARRAREEKHEEDSGDEDDI